MYVLQLYILETKDKNLLKCKLLLFYVQKGIPNQQQSLRYKRLSDQFQKLYQEYQSQPVSQKKYVVSTDFIASWKVFCNTQETYRMTPVQMNISLYDSTCLKLRNDLKQKIDFEYVSEECYKLFEGFLHLQMTRLEFEKQFKVNRDVPKRGQAKNTFHKYNYLSITNQNLKKIKQQQIKRENLKLNTIQQKSTSKISSLAYKILKQQNLQKQHQARLWKVTKQYNLDSLFQQLLIKVESAEYDYRIKGFGQRLQPNLVIQDLQIQEQDFFIVEVKQANKRWFLLTERQNKCQGCRVITEVKYPCECQQVSYCSQDCKQKDLIFHKKFCGQQKKDDQKQKKANNKNGKTAGFKLPLQKEVLSKNTKKIQRQNQMIGEQNYKLRTRQISKKYQLLQRQLGKNCFDLGHQQHSQQLFGARSQEKDSLQVQSRRKIVHLNQKISMVQKAQMKQTDRNQQITQTLQLHKEFYQLLVRSQIKDEIIELLNKLKVRSLEQLRSCSEEYLSTVGLPIGQILKLKKL